MADIGDVCNVLQTLAQTAVYPSGVAAGSPLGINFRIYRGHPGPAILDADMQAGWTLGTTGYTLTNPSGQIAHVCINARTGVGRLVRPYTFSGPQAQSIPSQTITITPTGSVTILSGNVSAGQGVAVSANGVCVGVAASSADTLQTLASALAAALNVAGITATSSGANVTVPSAPIVYANSFVVVPTGQEYERQIQGFEITLYVPSRNIRDQVSAALKPVFAQNQRIVMPDGFQALLKSAPPIEFDDDRPEKELLFIRKLYFNVEYATVVVGQASTQAIAQQAISDLQGNTLAIQVES